MAPAGAARSRSVSTKSSSRRPLPRRRTRVDLDGRSSERYRAGPEPLGRYDLQGVADHPDIGAETRERVLKRMKELNYRPNLAARALVTGRTHAIGLIVPDLVHPFFGQVAKALSSAIRTKGYSLMLSSSDDDPALEEQEIEQMLARRVDVLVVASAQRTPDVFRRIEEQKTPYILIDRRFDGLQAHFVGIDDVAAGRIATEHLFEAGCRRVAHIGGPEVSTADRTGARLSRGPGAAGPSGAARIHRHARPRRRCRGPQRVRGHEGLA